jgi:tetratricopeptide (TPR) repeat protein
MYQRGIDQMEAGDLPEAVATFSAIIRRKPAFAEAWNKRATLFYMMGLMEQSLQDCDQVIKRNRNHFGALSGYGQIYLARETSRGPPPISSGPWRSTRTCPVQPRCCCRSGTAGSPARQDGVSAAARRAQLRQARAKAQGSVAQAATIARRWPCDRPARKSPVRPQNEQVHEEAKYGQRTPTRQSDIFRQQPRSGRGSENRHKRRRRGKVGCMQDDVDQVHRS